MLNFFLPKSIIVRHLLFWIFLSGYFMLFDPVDGSIIANIVVSALVTGNYAFVYYAVGLSIFPRFWPNNQLLFLVLMFLAYILYASSDVLTILKLIPLFGGQVPTNYNYTKIFSVDVIYFTVISIISISNHYGKIVVKTLNEQNEKEKEQSEKEKLLNLKELNYLKSQFNTHITMNFLNFCYSNVHLTSPKTADAIELFSDILRYTLKTKPDELITLSEEIQYIQNYLELQKLLTSEVYVNFELSGDVQNKQILPRLLITFIENAFKHGQFNNRENPISISLQAKPQEIIFRVKNHKSNRLNRNTTSIGQNNLKKVLDIFYANQYRLDINSTEHSYDCSLALNTP